MVISAGYFQTTYFADRYWMADWWPEYGLAVGIARALAHFSLAAEALLGRGLTT